MRRLSRFRLDCCFGPHSHTMKTHLLHACALFTLTALSAQAEIIGVETFDYADGVINDKSGGTFWNWRNQINPGVPGAPGRTLGTSDWDVPTVASGRLITQDSSAQREYIRTGECLPIAMVAKLPTSISIKSSDIGKDSVACGLFTGSSGHFTVNDYRSILALTNSKNVLSSTRPTP